MPVIKGTNPTPAVEHAVVLDLGDLAAEARRLRDEARVAAERLLAEARVEAQHDAAQVRDAAAREGHDAGFADGQRAGREDGHEAAIEELRPRLEEVARQWSGAVSQWRSQRQAMLRQAREDVLVFAFELARRVVHRMVQTDPALVEDQLRDALSLVSRPTSVEVDVHPEDRPLLEEVLPTVLEQFKNCEHIRLHDAAAIGRGGCIVRTTGGAIDATIETQLERIAQTLLPEQEGK